MHRAFSSSKQCLIRKDGARIKGRAAALLVVLATAAFAQPTDPITRGHQAYRNGQYKQAAEAFEAAATVDPRSSNIHLWLGRAYGRLAETSSFLNAPRYASKCRQAFERATELDGKNLEAWNDLFAYYLEAPGFLGGGLDKAATAAKHIASLDATEGHFAQAKLAEKRRDFDTAEQELRRAAELAPKAVGRIVDLAVFLAHRGKRTPSEEAFARAAAIDASHPRYLFERAQILVAEKRESAEARRLLEAYLKANLGPDDPRPAEARKLLSQIKP